jgi:hypothetical protein
MHRVSRKHRDILTMPETELDAFLEGAVHARPTPSQTPGSWLTVAFDDGYDDACYYIETRARRFPDVEWLLFVCPDKAERRVGFRWDLPTVDHVSPRDIDTENRREDLRAAARLQDCHLASVKQARSLQLLPNADVGNHTNCHFRPVDLPLPRFEEELARSSADFARLFGSQRHFAFPFGTPEEDFDRRHVEVLRAIGDFVIWTTARQPYRPEHRRPGAVLPRFPVDGRRTPVQLAFWIALLSLRARTRGLVPLYAEPGVDLVPRSGERVTGSLDIGGLGA